MNNACNHRVLLFLYLYYDSGKGLPKIYIPAANKSYTVCKLMGTKSYKKKSKTLDVNILN